MLWNPSKIGDIQILEAVQRSFTSRIHGFQHLDYWQRLKALNLMSLQHRRDGYILVMMWKCLNQHCPNTNSLNISFKYSERKGNVAALPQLVKDSPARFRTCYDASFAVMGLKLWSSPFPSTSTRLTLSERFKKMLLRGQGGTLGSDHGK